MDALGLLQEAARGSRPAPLWTAEAPIAQAPRPDKERVQLQAPVSVRAGQGLRSAQGNGRMRSKGRLHDERFLRHLPGTPSSSTLSERTLVRNFGLALAWFGLHTFFRAAA